MGFFDLPWPAVAGITLPGMKKLPFCNHSTHPGKFDWHLRFLKVVGVVALLLTVLDLSAVNAQTANEGALEKTNPWAAEKPERNFQVLERTVIDRGDHSIIYQRVAPPPPAAPSAAVPVVKALSPQELEAQQRREAKQHTVLFFSATVLDHRVTELRWSEDGKEYRAFSNIDFRYFSSMGEIETTDAIYILMLALENGTSETLAERTREFPQISVLPKDRAAWVPADGSGQTNTPVMAALDAIHPYFDAHREALIRQYGEREAANAERERQLRENPPARKNTVIRYWRKTTPVAAPQNSGAQQ